MHEISNVVYYNSPIGILKLTGNERYLKQVTFCDQDQAENPSAMLVESRDQLHEYFIKKRKVFSIPLDPEGSTFQKEVWNLVGTIPYGRTASYTEIATRLGDADKVRAIGMANASNPIAIIIPCHRVIGLKGSLTGYSAGLQRKKWLLDHEQGAVQLKLPI